MKRRSFFKISSALSLPLLLNGIPLRALGSSPLLKSFETDTDRVLVLVQLQGGNDGLNAIIPIDQYDNLMAVRSNILLPQNAILNLQADLGLHPSMQGIKEIWDNGKVNILQSVGYPNQNRSHFRSTDIWNSASAAEEQISSGWFGRYLDADHQMFPTGYPNVDFPDPFALTIGNVVSETCQGLSANYSMAVSDPFEPGSVNTGTEGSAPMNCYGDELTYIRDIARQTNAYSEVIMDAANLGNNLSTKYGSDNELAQKLSHVARLISGGLKTKIYIVQIGGFDTHDNQVQSNDVLTGNQPELLQELSEAICAFQDDLNLLGLEERVIGMTYSEFGRRIRSNGSGGTDHGDAAPMIVFGSCVNPAIIGDNVEIDPLIDSNTGAPMQIDFRNVYGSILEDWFGVEENAVKSMIFDDYVKMPIVNACNAVCTSINDHTGPGLALKVFMEGPYNPSTGLMSSFLAENNLLPFNQPYNTSPWNYSGSESVSSFPANAVDWVLIELRSGTPNLSGTPGTTLHQSLAGLLLNDGRIVGMDGISDLLFDQMISGEAYYVLIRHRNHLDILSSNTIRQGINMSYDFTNCYAAFGAEQLKSLDGRFAMFAGDYNPDSVLQISDYDVWKADPAMLNAYEYSDGNLDGTVQVVDYDVWYANRAKTSPAEVQF